MQHRLVVLGSLYENIALVAEAKRRGIYTIVCDGYKNGHAKTLADKFYDIDIRNTDEVARMCIEERADGIVGSFSDIVFEKVTETAAKAGLPWYVPADRLKFYRDKKAAKDLLRSLGVSVPENRLIKKDFTSSDIEGLSYPLVIKPVNGWGSKGIYVADNEEEMREFIEKTVEASRSDTVLAEEYSKGKEYNITSFLTDGKVNVISCADREKTPSEDHTVPRVSRIIYPVEHHNDIIEAARDMLQRFADATGQKYGVLSTQCFYYKGQLTVCEVAGRIFAYESSLITRHTGLSIPGLLIDCIYDRESLKRKLEANKNHLPTEIYAGLYFFAKDGKKIHDMGNVYELCKYEKLIDDIIFYNEGEIIDNNSSKSYFAEFFYSAKDNSESNSITKHFYDNMKVYAQNNENIIYPSSINISNYNE